MSAERLSQSIARLVCRQSWCISSDSVVCLIGREKDSKLADLYIRLINYVLYQECSIKLASKVLLCSENMFKYTLGTKCV